MHVRYVKYFTLEIIIFKILPHCVVCVERAHESTIGNARVEQIRVFAHAPILIVVARWCLGVRAASCEMHCAKTQGQSSRKRLEARIAEWSLSAALRVCYVTR